MKHTRYITEIAESLAPANQPEGFGQLFVVLLRELAKGRPVSQTTLAMSLDWPAQQVNASTIVMGISLVMASPCARLRISSRLMAAVYTPGAHWTL